MIPIEIPAITQQIITVSSGIIPQLIKKILNTAVNNDAIPILFLALLVYLMNPITNMAKIVIKARFPYHPYIRLSLTVLIKGTIPVPFIIVKLCNGILIFTWLKPPKHIYCKHCDSS